MSLLAIPLIVITALGFIQLASAQNSEPVTYPGDPVSEDDKVFVTLDGSENATCGVTAANNIRCWGGTATAPMWAEGFTDVAVGNSHSCGLRLDKTVQCWGVNSFGAIQLTPPTENGSPILFKSIDSDTGYTCGIRDDNDGLVCWGLDRNGQASGKSAEGVSYDYLNDSFTKISTSSLHTCGLVVTADGDSGTNMRCWGSDRQGSSTVPQAYSSNVFKDLDTGELGFTCGIIEGGENDGKAVCWGSNDNSQLGTPLGTSVTEMFIGAPSVDSFTQISAGRHHVCGIKTDGTVTCWGASPTTDTPDYGQADVPAEHRTSTFGEVLASRYHTCGILDGRNDQTAGEVVCWGVEITHDPLNPQVTNGGRAILPDSFQPPVHKFPQIASGAYFNCGLTADRDLFCWGDTTLTPGFEEGPFKTLDIGVEHVCAIRDSGRISCWGFNNNLQASGWSPGWDPDNPPTTPLYSSTAGVPNLTTDYTFKSVSASYLHTCGILDGQTAGQTAGSVLCWGHNSNGQATPPDTMTFSSISAGWYHTCGLLDSQNGQAAGTAVCWGAINDVDADGNVVPTVFRFDSRADFGQADVPETLSSVALKSISANRYHTCAVREDNDELVCWSRARIGTELIAAIPDEIGRERFSMVATSWYATCGTTADSLLKCWSGISHPIIRNFDLPSDYVDIRFVGISTGARHVCATREDGGVVCFGADANVNTPELEIYAGSTIVNTRQAWVPRSFRTLPEEPVESTPTPGPRPTGDVRILRIEPYIRGVTLRPGEPVRLGVQVYGRQNIRDDSLGDRPEITFEWIDGVTGATELSGIGAFEESVASYEDRQTNSQPDDRRVLYNAPLDPGRYFVKASLDIGTECLPKRDGETDEDAIARCTAIFDIIVQRRSPEEPTPVPPENPPGEIPDVIVDDDGTNYEVFTPELGGEFITEKCSLKIPKGAVNDMEVIGISVTELEDPDEQFEIDDPRFMTEGIQCEISVVDANGEAVSDYRLLKPGQICMPLPKPFRAEAVNALVGSINPDATLTRLTSKLFFVRSAGTLNVCGSIGIIPATTVVALPAEAAGELPTTPVPTPDVADIDTGGASLTSGTAVFILLFSLATATLGIALVLARRRRNAL
ncbi:MAG: hypothetical protein OXC83_01940 [Chloroflexi bacterium]|nr:hypothetical protein [Chloroflexota bacterium]